MKEYNKFTSMMAFAVAVIASLTFGIVGTAKAETSIEEQIAVSDLLMNLVKNNPTKIIKDHEIIFNLNREIFAVHNYDELVNTLLDTDDKRVILKVIFNNGGQLDSLEKIVKTLSMVDNDKVATYGDAYSAGAYLSCADTKVYVEPGSKLWFHWVRIGTDPKITPADVKEIYDDVEKFLVGSCVKNGLLTLEEVKFMRTEAEKLKYDDVKPFIGLTSEQVKERVGDRWEED